MNINTEHNQYEAAEHWYGRLNRSRVWFHRLRKRGLPSYRLAGRVYVKRGEADAWFEAQLIPADDVGEPAHLAKLREGASEE